MAGSDAVCAVLAGGVSRRLGRPKAMEPLGDRALIEYPLAAAAAAGLETVVVAKADSRLPVLEVELVEEPAEPRHPLCGIVAALQAVDDRAIVVVGCDMPFIAPDLLAYLAGIGSALTVCESGGRLQPLLGRYEPSLLPQLSRALADELALTEAVVSLDPRVIRAAELARFGDPARITFNVNDPADLEAAEKMLGGSIAP